MEEEDYWSSLEFDLSRRLEGMGEYERIGVWFDGFVPTHDDFSSMPPRVYGLAWVGFGPRRMQQWVFRLVLAGRPDGRASVDWGKQVPPEDVSAWVALDFEKLVVAIGLPAVGLDGRRIDDDGELDLARSLGQL